LDSIADDHWARTGDDSHGGLDRLTIKHCSTRLAVFAGGHSDITTEQVVHELPGAILAPLANVVIDDPPRGQIVR
jgi:hypothetical protein